MARRCPILSKEYEEQGAVLIITAMLGMVLLMFVAYAIDLSMYANSREAAGQYSRLAALSAIEGYFSAQPPADKTDAEKEQIRLDAALLRANQITLSNKTIDGKSSRRSAATILAAGAPEARDTDKPVLTPGRWYFRWPSTGAEEVKAGCENKLPCFLPLTSGQNANAMQIKGTLYTSALSNLAHNAFGTAELPAKISATASVVPRHGCFLVDLSPSVTAETHLMRTPVQQATDGANGHGRVFGFYLGKDNEWLPFPDPEHPEVTAPDMPNPAYVPGQYDPDYIDPDTNQVSPRCINMNGWFSNHDCWFDVLKKAWPNRPEGGETEPYFAQRHYADDYVRMRMLADASYDAMPERYKKLHPDYHSSPETYGVGPGQWVHVDAFRKPGYYDGPKPLQMILSGLHAAITGFQKRAVAGDKLCLIFYDRQLAWPRIVKLTDDFEYLLRFTSTDYDHTKPPPSADPDPISPDARLPTEGGFQTIVRHGIFPTTGGFTNMQMALSEASKQLAEGEEEGVPSSDFVVLIGDGMTNCPTAEICGNTWYKYKTAMSELKALVAQYFVPSEIPVHVIMAGDSVAPHTVVRKHSDSNKCYTGAESRKEGLAYVIGGDAGGQPFASDALAADAFSKASPETPFYQVNADMYEIAAATNGLWAPIRETKGVCTPLADCKDFASAQRYLDDPQCRTVDEQMDAYMDEILGLNPYALVDLN